MRRRMIATSNAIVALALMHGEGLPVEPPAAFERKPSGKDRRKIKAARKQRRKARRKSK